MVSAVLSNFVTCLADVSKSDKVKVSLVMVNEKTLEKLRAVTTLKVVLVLQRIYGRRVSFTVMGLTCLLYDYF